MYRLDQFTAKILWFVFQKSIDGIAMLNRFLDERPHTLSLTHLVFVVVDFDGVAGEYLGAWADKASCAIVAVEFHLLSHVAHMPIIFLHKVLRAVQIVADCGKLILKAHAGSDLFLVGSWHCFQIAHFLMHTFTDLRLLEQETLLELRALLTNLIQWLLALASFQFKLLKRGILTVINMISEAKKILRIPHIDLLLGLYLIYRWAYKSLL